MAKRSTQISRRRKIACCNLWIDIKVMSVVLIFKQVFSHYDIRVRMIPSKFVSHIRSWYATAASSPASGSYFPARSPHAALCTCSHCCEIPGKTLPTSFLALRRAFAPVKPGPP